MMGYVPQLLPQSYVESRSLRGFGEAGYSAPPMVSLSPGRRSVPTEQNQR